MLLSHTDHLATDDKPEEKQPNVENWFYSEDNESLYRIYAPIGSEPSLLGKTKLPQKTEKLEDLEFDLDWDEDDEE